MAPDTTRRKSQRQEAPPEETGEADAGEPVVAEREPEKTEAAERGHETASAGTEAPREKAAEEPEAMEPFSSGPDVALVFAREYYGYQTALMHIQGEANRRFEQASQRFGITVQHQQAEANRRIGEAYRGYSVAFNSHQIDPEEVPIEAVDAACQTYLKAHQQAQIDAQAASAAAQTHYEEAVEAVAVEAGERRGAAFRDFVAAIRDAWAGIDAAEMTSARLASIAQTTFAAAACVQIG